MVILERLIASGLLFEVKAYNTLLGDKIHLNYNNGIVILLT